MTAKRIEKFQGFWVQKNDEGFFWENGPDGDGYFETRDECIASINDYNISASKFPMDDTPSVDDHPFSAASVRRELY